MLSKSSRTLVNRPFQRDTSLRCHRVSDEDWKVIIRKVMSLESINLRAARLSSDKGSSTSTNHRKCLRPESGLQLEVNDGGTACHE
jgi:hypothetical protein